MIRSRTPAAAVRLRPQWTRTLPPGVLDSLTGDPAVDRKRLDAWASEHTGGLIGAMPVTLDPQIVLVLATALAVRTRWLEPFTDVPVTAASGPWAGRSGVQGLRRSTRNLDDATVLDTGAGRVTRLRVEGSGGIDVHLLLGEEGSAPAAVLAHGMDLAVPATPGSSLPLGANAPGLTVEETRASDPRPELAVQAVRFAARDGHDLLASPIFGLRAASRSPQRPGLHFPAISDDPLAVSQARQDAMAVFSSTGFEAAAVTAVAMTRAAYVAPDSIRKTVRVTIDRPFGFFATHRATGLILVAGWINEP